MKPAKPVKLTRAQVKAGIEQTPIENILLGSLNADKVRLTKKQKDFAKAVALGKPKAQAYREAYDSKGKPATQSNEGHKLMKNPAISAMIEAFTLANEAREYLIPAQIRTMAIQNLVSIAINDGEKTSNKLKALELIGKMSEVSLFSETKTHVHLHSSEDIRGQLLAGLKLAFSNSRGLNDLAKRKAESLLIELSEAGTIDNDETESADESDHAPAHYETDNSDDPPTTDPQKSTNAGSNSMHSIPLIQSDSNTLLADLTPPADEVTNPLESDTCASIGNYPNKGEGVIISGQSAPEVSHETPPVNISEKKW
jgi:hypothetical protein